MVLLLLLLGTLPPLHPKMCFKLSYIPVKITVGKTKGEEAGSKISATHSHISGVTSRFIQHKLHVPGGRDCSFYFSANLCLTETLRSDSLTRDKGVFILLKSCPTRILFFQSDRSVRVGNVNWEEIRLISFHLESHF